MPFLRVLLTFSLLFLLGCGGSSSNEPTVEVFPVSGTVLVDGEALPSVTVAFVPKPGTSGLGGFAVTDAAGKFNIKYKGDRDGVPEGNYSVLFSRMVKPDGSPIGNDEIAATVEAVNELPNVYNDPENTPVTATVTSSNDPFKFELKGKGK